MKVEALLNPLLDTTPHPRIVEVGCRFTLDIARWVEHNADALFDSVDLNGPLQQKVHAELEAEGLAKFCTFRTQDPEKWLSGLNWADAVFLDPDGLQAGLTQFSLAASVGPQLVVIKGYQSTAAMAVSKAKAIGWDFEYDSAMSILRSNVRKADKSSPWRD